MSKKQKHHFEVKLYFWGWSFTYLNKLQIIHMFCSSVVNGTPADLTHLFKKNQSPFDLPMYCLRELWSAGTQNDQGWQLLCQLAVTGLQQKAWRELWPHQMPYSRVQLMPHTVKTNSVFHIKWLDCNILAINFGKAAGASYIHISISKCMNCA